MSILALLKYSSHDNRHLPCWVTFKGISTPTNKGISCEECCVLCCFRTQFLTDVRYNLKLQVIEMGQACHGF